jgi:hypothetical protein
MSLENVALALVLTSGIVTTLLTVRAITRGAASGDDKRPDQSRRDAEQRRYAAGDTPTRAANTREK